MTVLTVLMRIVVLVLLVVAALLGSVLFLPDSAQVERNIEISAPPEAVYAQIADFRKWPAWSPWAAHDPDMKLTYQGPRSGIGAKMIWQSEHRKVKSGSQLITAAKPPRLVRSRLDFGEQGGGDAYFRIEPIPGGSRVTWGFDTSFGSDPIARIAGLFLDQMLGPEYERGLENLRSLVEGSESSRNAPGGVLGSSPRNSRQKITDRLAGRSPPVSGWQHDTQMEVEFPTSRTSGFELANLSDL